jgi:hypothetical protein
MWHAHTPEAFVLVWALIGSFGSAPAAHGGPFERQETVQNVEIHYGIVPGERIRAFPEASSERHMHGGPPRGRGHQHLMVTLFDARTKQRIENAVVRAKVGEAGFGVEEKQLEAMGASGSLAYGNYFRMTGPGTYRITVQIRTRDPDRTIERTMQYAPGRN